MVATQLFIMGMGFLDTAMAGRYSSVDLAGVAMGGNLLWPVFMFMTGLTMAVTPMVAQLTGGEKIGDAGGLVRQGVWIALTASVATMIIMQNAEPFFYWIGVDEAVTVVATGYLDAASWGMPASMIYVVLRYTSEGLGHTRPPMVIAGAALALNAPLNYVFIYGAFGFPELGGVGCGWATSIVMWFEVLAMLIVVRKPFFRETNFLTRFAGPELGTIVRILKIGLPIGLTIFLEMAVYSVIGFLIATLGINALAAHSIAGNLNWMTYVIPMSLGSAAAIRVGFYVGAQRPELSRQVAATAFQISLAYALVVSVLVAALRYVLVGIYTEDAAVLDIAAKLLLIIAVYQIVDDTNATMAGALRGYKDTRVPMVFSLVGYWLFALPLGYFLATGPVALGVYGYWVGMAIGLLLVAICMGVRLWNTSHDLSKVQRLALG
ncbi:MAG: MATE family efflux transporter [Gammaproteobacteria bacterium]|nr:MATE family efflux transporter [Gammaproteobacteria bacterium]